MSNLGIFWPQGELDRQLTAPATCAPAQAGIQPSGFRLRRCRLRGVDFETAQLATHPTVSPSAVALQGVLVLYDRRI
ncbi:hypothetical protein CLAFUW4_06212 [Fulvia fulva]|uniref:Uncharacterized protein n=1 Tax=Passalora fulva TaxID=5499 RepID=A0A9Q8LHX5_PASFU|nr:uncharacterized protein CLAFUR5_06356 [Fulvia fulva]KAK4623961.1 hypothetical protein CLAFUR4_06215 [Fulvia fulva]KAK4624841.1 hypothetical protein CLAFUR0_06219 [Fulvia fulva]UJO17727.1 hypothetical protein CLAFUR5_06356 [Fulvia fulva]WPV15526.1 hypothetical protein CLAFUW4_06212 [Fulvia fulva]WPV29456.1 hypothetical protein CLAFUW7_06208 [Fulvia fulva]